MSARERRGYVGFTLIATCVTAYFSYAYFHLDEYFQVLELTRKKLEPASVPVLPWEHAEQIRPWLQPFLYWIVACVLRPLGVRDVFDLAFVFRLVTGLANVGALALFLRTTLPWFGTDAARRLHLRVATCAGFLPYLFVRTSSEAASMAALTTAFAIVLEGATATLGRGDRRAWSVPALDRPARLLLAGFLFGVAFEMRFQTALVPLGLGAWLFFSQSRSRALRAAALFAAGGALMLVLALFVDRWGYGEWTFPPWSYFRVNLLEGAASLFGADPPFAYLWMLPANVFFPVAIAFVLLALLGWSRHPRHPLTWSTLPFVLFHNLLSHKEERFLFPVTILMLGVVSLSLSPVNVPVPAPVPESRPDRVAKWASSQITKWPAKLLTAWSFAFMLLLAFFPLGWNHDVRFTRALHDRFGDEVHATAFPEIELDLPPFHPRVWDLDKADPEEVERRVQAGTAREWLITSLPSIPPGIEAAATLVYSELPGATDPGRRASLMRLVDAYNARAKMPLRRLRYHTLYRMNLPFGPSAGLSAGPQVDMQVNAPARR